MSSNSQIKQVFKNQTVFLTGATGFLGKVLIEKLLRECEDLKRIYILVRLKKGKNIEERYKDIFETRCFDLLKSKNVNVEEKVVLVGGDCEEPFLGLSDDDLETLKRETNFVLHAAADVRFDQSLKTAALHIRGTKDILEMAKEMINLKAFVYVSTAYSNCIYSHIKEETQKSPINFDTLSHLVEDLEEKTLECITPQLLGKWPNCYVFSKCISENVVENATGCFPIAIVRPAIVMNSAEEPMEGWIDNMYGPIGVSLGASAGIIRTFYARNDAIAYLVPVDYVCNCILAATWKTVNEKCSEIKMYNYIRFNKNPLKWEYYISLCWSHYWSYGIDKVVWCNTFAIRENKLWNDICTFWLHTFPSYFIDGVLICLRRPPMAVRSYQKINKILSLISSFSTRTWIFDDDNVSNLWDEMTEGDRKLFKFRNNDLEWKDFMRNCTIGAKRFLFNEPIVDSLRRRIKLATFMVIHYACLALFWYLVYKLFAFIFSVFW